MVRSGSVIGETVCLVTSPTPVAPECKRIDLVKIFLCPVDDTGRGGRTEAVVDIYHRHSGRAAVEHAQQCRKSPEMGSIAD